MSPLHHRTTSPLSSSSAQRLAASLVRLTLLTATSSAALYAFVQPPAALHAQEAEMQQLLEGAMEDYDLVMLDEAEQKLEDAVALAATKGISGEPLARVFVMLGIVRFARDRSNEADTKQAFIAAIEAYPSIVIDPLYETPELSRIFESARKEAKPAANTSNNTPSNVKGFQHTKLISAEGNQPLTIDASVSEDIPVFRMFVHHRRFGEEQFKSVEMSPTSATRFEGTIPANEVTTSQLDYYIEALDRAGNVIAGVGSENEPVETLVRGGEGDGSTVNVDGGQGGSDIKPIDSEPSDSNDHVYIMLAGGTGLGFLPGGTPTARPSAGAEPRTVNPGVAATIGHAMLDLGWIINKSMRLGLYARWQFSPPQDFAAVPEEQKSGSFPSTKQECLGLGLSGDCLLGLKYRYFFADKGPDETRFYSSVGVGVGRVRHWVQLKENVALSSGQPNQECEGKQRFQGQDSAGNNVEYCLVRDTVRTGWGHFGLGGGVTVPIGSVVEFVADSYLMFHTLDQTSINLDVNAGFNFRF